ncbi:hypothetical protein [Rhizobium sp. NZLR1b]|uniref:hypothetical protein n=1 Tax=Rhizobium sp. NZLR1b TaxID=2731099 RepID=UPI001C83ABF7|nr:hypothetical protein [Rhizobium sp. NZLR1b]
MPEISPPYVRTELTGAAQAADPRAMPLSAYIAEVMAMLEHGNHPRGGCAQSALAAFLPVTHRSRG